MYQRDIAVTTTINAVPVPVLIQIYFNCKQSLSSSAGNEWLKVGKNFTKYIFIKSLFVEVLRETSKTTRNLMYL